MRWQLVTLVETKKVGQISAKHKLGFLFTSFKCFDKM